MSVTVGWGINTPKGNLGVGDGSNTHRTPTNLAGSVAFTQANCADATLGAASVALAEDGTVYGFGDNVWNQLGLGASDSSNHQTPITIPGLPAAIKTLSGADANGWALASDGDLWAWGHNGQYEFGLGTTSQDYVSPVLVNTDVADFALGAAHAILLKKDGSVWSCGSAGLGQCAVVANPYIDTWQDVTPGSGVVVQVACCWNSTFLRMADGTVQCCGASITGVLGIGPESPTAHNSLFAHPATDVAFVATANETAFFLLNDGTSWSIGGNTNGLLGAGIAPGTLAQTSTLQAMNWPSGITPTRWGAYCTRDDTAHALGSDAQAYTWGNGSAGQMGNNGTTATNTSPITVNGLTALTWVGGNGRSLFAGDAVPIVTLHGRSFVSIVG